MILAFGDSLTKGYGVEYEDSYPAKIREKTDFEIMNVGIDGEFSAQGLSRLDCYTDEDLSTVLLCHGANDILCRYSISKLKDNLVSMIKLLQEKELKIILIGVPDFYSVNATLHPVYEEVAKEMDVYLEAKVLIKILEDSSLRNDEVHPNEAGYELMADTFLKLLK